MKENEKDLEDYKKEVDAKIWKGARDKPNKKYEGAEILDEGMNKEEMKKYLEKSGKLY